MTRVLYVIVLLSWVGVTSFFDTSHNTSASESDGCVSVVYLVVVLLINVLEIVLWTLDNRFIINILSETT